MRQENQNQQEERKKEDDGHVDECAQAHVFDPLGEVYLGLELKLLGQVRVHLIGVTQTGVEAWEVNAFDRWSYLFEKLLRLVEHVALCADEPHDKKEREYVKRDRESLATKYDKTAEE